MKNYKYFLFESKDKNDKITWIKVGPVNSTVESKKLKELIETALENFYTLIHVSDKTIPTINKDAPILIYFGTNEDGIQLLKDQNIKQSDVYNKTVEARKALKKADWHKLLGDKDWLPKTVLDKKDINKLEFPIIAKPSEGHSGVGIMKFDNMEDCQKEIDKKDCNLDTFSEMIKDIDTEYRFIFVKDELFLVLERIGIIKDNKTITTKDPKESLSFLYVEQDLEKGDYDVKDIVKEFRKDFKQDFYALDIILDTHGKYWVIESNGGIGMGGNTMSRTYEAIYKDFYNKDIPADKKKLVEKICKEYHDEIKKDYPKEFKQSKNPKTY